MPEPAIEPMLPDDPDQPKPQPSEKPSGSIDEPPSPSEPQPTRKAPEGAPPIGDPTLDAPVAQTSP